MFVNESEFPWKSLAPAIAFLCLSSMTAIAQSTYATITGLATDASGAMISAVEVEAVQVETNYKYAVKTNETGQYTIANIREGTYRLSAKAAGFQDLVMDNIVLAARDLRRIDLSLQVGAAQSRIEVQAESAQIETESGRISH